MINWSKTMVAAVATILSLLTTFTFVSAAPTYTLLGNAAYYEIQGLTFKDADNNIVGDITDNGKISSVVLTKLTDEAMPAVVAVAVYGADRKLRTMAFEDITSMEFTGQPISCPIDVPLGQNTQGLFVKVFVWNSMNGLIPLAGVYTESAVFDGVAIEVAAVEGNDSIITFAGSAIDSLSGKTFIVTFDTDILEISDTIASTPMIDLNINTTIDDVTITSVGEGIIMFSINKNISQGKLWSGVLNKIRFNGLQTNNTTVVLSIQ
ncbi:MAG: hypothetical protein GX800_03810 [Clostridiaceae bacterium]|nr:hypothetical protein [Clostridiaceae bacterium]